MPIRDMLSIFKKKKKTVRLKVKGWKKSTWQLQNARKIRNTKYLNYTINDLDLIHICRTLKLYLQNTYIFLGSYWMFTKTDYILGHKISISKC